MAAAASASSASCSSKILMLVLCSKGGPDGTGLYVDMMAATRAYYATVPGLDVVYYMYDPDQTEDILRNGDVLTFRGTETLVPGCLAKTLAALRYFEPHLDAYKYVLRPNASTIVNVDLFRGLVDTGPCAIAYGAPDAARVAPTWRDPSHGIVDGRYAGLVYASGICIVMTPAIARFLLATVEAGVMDMAVVDDMAIGKAIRNLPHVKCTVFRDNLWFVPDFEGDDVALGAAVASRKATCVVYRCKTGDRATDVHQMRTIVGCLCSGVNE